MESKKWYGLTIPKKATKVNTKGKSVFESDDSNDSKEDHVKIKEEPSSPPKEKKKRVSDSKPDEIDPNIYEYDSIYDEMKASQKQKSSHTKSKEPRYINLLLKAADKRKKESDKRVERKIQAERVKEGDAFKDKEAFVTSAYRQKMVEMEEEEERERRESALEDMMDSTKQKDLSGFYRHFLKQTVGEERVPEFGERDAKISTPAATKKKHNYSQADKSRQRSESPIAAKPGKKHSTPDEKDVHSVVKQETGKSHKSDFSKSESKHGVHGEPNKAGHSKDKSSSHKSKSRHQSDSSSDSENKKSRHSEEKSHRKKSVHTTHSSKLLHNGKAKNSLSSRNQEAKNQDKSSSGNSKSPEKQASPSEKHSSSQSRKSDDSHSRRSKPDKFLREYKKDAQTLGKTEKGSLLPPRAAVDERTDSDKRSSRNKSRLNKAEKLSGSQHKKRESRSSDDNDEHSEIKRQKCSIDDDDDDDDASSTSSVEDRVSVQNNQELENKVAPENPKIGMMAKFTKRTVGEIFDNAQARYFKRRDVAKAIG